MDVRNPRRPEGYEADPVAPAPMAGAAAAFRLQLIVWFLTGLTCVLLAIRFFLLALGADPRAEFATFIYGITQPLTAPFHDLFGGGAVGRFVFDPAALIAIPVYLLVGWGVVTLIRILSPRWRTRLPG